MVVESDRAGEVVMCPNCRRSLKVPTGKDRGVEITSAPTAQKIRTSRLCQRCGKEVPVDSQMCPHCKAILLDAPGAARAAAAAPKVAGVAAPVGAKAAAQPQGPAILYGGSRASSFSRLTAGAKAGAIGGAVAFVLVLVVIGYFLYTSWYAGQVVASRQEGQRAIDQGKKFENIGKFQEAYEGYHLALNMQQFLRQTGERRDADLADHLQARANALHYLVPDPKTRGSVYWKPKNQQEYDQALSDLAAKYPNYRQWILALTDTGLAAVQTAKTNPSQPVYEEKVGLTMDAYVRFIAQTNDQQRAQYTFQMLLEAIRAVAGANRNWDKPARAQYLTESEVRLGAVKERASAPGYPDAIWER
jgi:hypothetical protein